MNFKKILTVTSIIIISAAIVFLISMNESRFFIWNGFGSPPKGAGMNCGPENRYKFDVTVNSKQDFVDFLKNYDGKILDQYGNNWVSLDNFKDDVRPGMNYTDIKNAKVNWNRVLSAIEVSWNGALFLHQKVYILKYTPAGCYEFTIKVTESGFVSVYGCCGI